MEKITDWEIEVIPQNKYYVIQNGITQEIWADEANDLVKKWIYHIYWKINDYKDDVVIFDFDKDSAIPLLRFLQTYSPEDTKSNLFLYVWVWLFAVIIWFLFFWDSSDNTNTVSTPTIPIEQIIPQSPKIDAEQIKQEIQRDLLQNTQTSNNELQITQYEDTITRLTREIWDTNHYNSRLLTDINECRADFTEAKELARDLTIENVNISEELKNTRDELLEPSQLYLYLWQYLFDLCETQDENAQCKQIIYDFYNLRK